MSLDAEGADSGDAPEEEAEDVSQVSKDQLVQPPLSGTFTGPASQLCLDEMDVGADLGSYSQPQ